MGKTILVTREHCFFFLRKIVLPIVVVHLSLCAAATINNRFHKKDERAAILISDYAVTKHDYWVSPLALVGAYPYWTYYFNNRGMRVKWFLHAKSADLARVIRDERFRSIVLVGHGSLNAWLAVDKLVTNDDVTQMMMGLSKKTGEWIQLTCAVADQWPVKMGALVMNDRNVYTYDDSVNMFYLVADAILGFKLIKSHFIQRN